MVELKFQVSLSDFREASYFGMFMRKRNAFRVAVGVLLFTVVYLILWKCGVVHMIPALLLFSCAYLVWVLCTLARIECQISRYVKQPGNLIGTEYSAYFDDDAFAFDIPAEKFHVHGKIDELSGAYELFHCFLIYVTAQQLFILPIRSMKKSELPELRTILKRKLGNRFSSVVDNKR